MGLVTKTWRAKPANDGGRASLQRCPPCRLFGLNPTQARLETTDMPSLASLVLRFGLFQWNDQPMKSACRQPSFSQKTNCLGRTKLSGVEVAVPRQKRTHTKPHASTLTNHRLLTPECMQCRARMEKEKTKRKTNASPNQPCPMLMCCFQD